MKFQGNSKYLRPGNYKNKQKSRSDKKGKL